MKRIVLFVEGEGESEAAPMLVKQILSDIDALNEVFPDPAPFRVGGVNKLLKDNCKEWKRFLAASSKRRNVGGILLLLDSDIDAIGQIPFCAATVAKMLAKEAAAVQGGIAFSVAVVFARQEFESWLIAGVESFAGKSLPDGRKIDKNAKPPTGDLEISPRDAKGWLNKNIEGGYKPTRDQAALTGLVDLGAIRQRNLRSFKRLESALAELVEAIRDDRPVATPK